VGVTEVGRKEEDKKRNYNNKKNLDRPAFHIVSKLVMDRKVYSSCLLYTYYIILFLPQQEDPFSKTPT